MKGINTRTCLLVALLFSAELQAAVYINSSAEAAGALTNNGSGVLGWLSLGSFGGGGLSGTTNFINLSVQAGKLPQTNYPGIDAGNQNWELVYYRTNSEGSVSPLGSTWQFRVPRDYATNSLTVNLQSILLSTNGPNTSNTVFRASIFRATSGDSTDLHVGAFGTSLMATNTWTQSTSNTNKMQDLTIAIGANSLLQAGDFAILKVERVSTNDTYVGATSVVGLQLEYTRP